MAEPSAVRSAPTTFASGDGDACRTAHLGWPPRVLRYRLRTNSGGAGYSPGGEGIERDLQVMEDCTASLITERRVSQPWASGAANPER